MKKNFVNVVFVCRFIFIAALGFFALMLAKPMLHNKVQSDIITDDYPCFEQTFPFLYPSKGYFTVTYRLFDLDDQEEMRHRINSYIGDTKRADVIAVKLENLKYGTDIMPFGVITGIEYNDKL